MCDDTCATDGVKVDYESVVVATVANIYNDLLEYFNDKKVPRPVTIAAAVLFIDLISVANVDEFVEATAIVSAVKKHIGESPDGE